MNDRGSDRYRIKRAFIHLRDKKYWCKMNVGNDSCQVNAEWDKAGRPSSYVVMRKGANNKFDQDGNIKKGECVDLLWKGDLCEIVEIFNRDGVPIVVPKSNYKTIQVYREDQD